MTKVLSAVILVCLFFSSLVRAQAPGEILDVSFEEIPAGVVLQSDPIGLQGDSNVSGQLSVTTGVEFGDGSIQTTAATTPEGASANAGLYNNRIPSFTPPNAYTEICIKGGALLADIHVISEPPSGGSCEPGDLGWIIERDQREAVTWARARLACLFDGMRLPEPFEWQLSCEEAASFGLNEMTDDREWAANSAIPQYNGSITGLGAAVFGLGSCSNGTWNWVANSSGASNSHAFRCIK